MFTGTRTSSITVRANVKSTLYGGMIWILGEEFRRLPMGETVVALSLTTMGFITASFVDLVAEDRHDVGNNPPS